MYLRLCTHIDAAGWFLQYEHLAVSNQCSTDHDFLLIPSAEEDYLLAILGKLYIKVFIYLVELFFFAAVVNEQTPEKGEQLDDDDGHIVQHRHIGKNARVFPVVRHIPESQFDGVMRRVYLNRFALEYNLTKHGYEVSTAADGVSGLEIARREQPDLILLDIMLPKMDGLEVCRILRQEMNVPIIMLTARGDEVDRVVGLEVGADDYVTKPFSMRELLARVKAQLRRVQFVKEELADATQETAPDVLVFDDLTMDVGRHEIVLREAALHLRPKEYDLLLFLGRNRGMTLSRDLILERVWGWEFSGGTRTVDVHIRWLREKIEPDPARPTRIVTVRGVGYRFEG